MAITVDITQEGSSVFLMRLVASKWAYLQTEGERTTFVFAGKMGRC